MIAFYVSFVISLIILRIIQVQFFLSLIIALATGMFWAVTVSLIAELLG